MNRTTSTSPVGRLSGAAVLLLMALGTPGCGEKPQHLGAGKLDQPAYQGTGTTAPYSAAGWKAGDKTSWEQHLKARAQSGQNDYSKAN